jgi:hypothetical protein
MVQQDNGAKSTVLEQMRHLNAAFAQKEFGRPDHAEVLQDFEAGEVMVSFCDSCRVQRFTRDSQSACPRTVRKLRRSHEANLPGSRIRRLTPQSDWACTNLQAAGTTNRRRSGNLHSEPYRKLSRVSSLSHNDKLSASASIRYGGVGVGCLF